MNDDEALLEIAKLERTAVETVRRRIAEEQRGELFTNLDKVKNLIENPPN